MSEKFAFWKSMDGTHKLTFVLLMIVTVTFPVFLFAVMNPKLPMFSRASDPVTPPDPPVVDYCKEMPGNLIKNYNFESGKSNWNFQKGSDGKFTTVDDTYSCLKVAQVAMAKNAKAQLSQSGILLEPNTTYEVSFAAKASEARNLNVFVHRHSKPYTNYGLKYTASLTTQWQTFTTTFTTPAVVDSNSRIRFWFAGRKGDTYWIDNVVLKKAVAVNPVNFETPYAKLNSSNFYIRIGDQYFYGQNPINTHSDPGSSEYTTLENTWNENGVEMRLFMYFKTLPENSHTRWRLFEVRTYDGNPQGEWIYYNPTGGHIVESEIGSPNYLDPRYFVPTNGTDAEIYCEKCTIIPSFGGQSPTPTPTTALYPTNTPIPSPANNYYIDLFMNRVSPYVPNGGGKVFGTAIRNPTGYWDYNFSGSFTNLEKGRVYQLWLCGINCSSHPDMKFTTDFNGNGNFSSVLFGHNEGGDPSNRIVVWEIPEPGEIPNDPTACFMVSINSTPCLQTNVDF